MTGRRLKWEKEVGTSAVNFSKHRQKKTNSPIPGFSTRLCNKPLFTSKRPISSGEEREDRVTERETAWLLPQKREG